MMEKIELIVFDIDGVLTDGCITVDADGNESKRINLKDVDAIFELHRRGVRLAAITGEDTRIVDWFEQRFPWEYFYRGNKEKLETLKRIEKDSGVSAKNIAYIGDGKYDVEPLRYAGKGFCPANAIDSARSAADVILQKNGGEGCVGELIDYLDKKRPCVKALSKTPRWFGVGSAFAGFLVYKVIKVLVRRYQMKRFWKRLY